VWGLRKVLLSPVHLVLPLTGGGRDVIAAGWQRNVVRLAADDVVDELEHVPGAVAVYARVDELDRFLLRLTARTTRRATTRRRSTPIQSPRISPAPIIVPACAPCTAGPVPVMLPELLATPATSQ
jgi:hypothetical protein